jgi:hypothetical protein
MPDNALAIYIEAVAAALAADLIDAADVRDLTDDNLALAQALAEKRPGNAFAIHPMATGEALSLQLQNGAYVLGLGLTTSARLRDRCLAGRDDADDLMAIIEMRAAKIAAPISPRPAPRRVVLSNDDGEIYQAAVGPSLYFPLSGSGLAGRSAACSPGSSGASLSCVRGRHKLGPLDHFGRATCLDCGMVNVVAEPGGPIEVHSGNAPPVNIA